MPGKTRTITAPRHSLAVMLLSMLVLAMACSAPARSQLVQAADAWLAPQALQSAPLYSPEDGIQALLAFQDSEIKFSLQSLMDILRDHQHEGWVLAAYPDPTTGRPLIGAGFSLDVPATVHLQKDPLNPRPFVEPSAAQLWQAAGLPPQQLQQILDQFQHNATVWTKRKYRKKTMRHALTPQLTDEQATRLLRISVLQAIYNGRAYCRRFDQLTGPQQMALSQLVFQMGTNLEQFAQFLDAINDDGSARELAQLDGYLETYPEHWRTVQETLIDSQWARRYTRRATAVIAMFDPEYSQAPGLAEQRIASTLLPQPIAHPRNAHTSTLRLASYSKRGGRAHSKKRHSSTVRRKLT